MTGGDALLTIAQLAISLAGFSAVVSAFTVRGELTQADRSKFLWLIATALVAALLAFVPIILDEARMDGIQLWRVSSLIMVLAWFVSMGIWLVELLRDRRRRSSPSFADGPLLVVPSVGNLILQLFNVSGMAWQPSPAAYIVGTLVWLYAASLAFLSIVLERPGD